MKSLVKLVGQSHVPFLRSGRGPLQNDRPLRLPPRFPDVHRGGCTSDGSAGASCCVVRVSIKKLLARDARCRGGTQEPMLGQNDQAPPAYYLHLFWCAIKA